MPRARLTPEQRAENHRINLRKDYRKHRERRLAAQYSFYREQPEKMKEKKRRYYEKNKYKFRIWCKRAEARKKGLDPDKLYPITYPRQIKRVLS